MVFSTKLLEIASLTLYNAFYIPGHRKSTTDQRGGIKGKFVQSARSDQASSYHLKSQIVLKHREIQTDKYVPRCLLLCIIYCYVFVLFSGFK